MLSREIGARRDGFLDALAAALREGREHSRSGEELPAMLEDFLVAGAASLATRSAIRDHGRPPTELGAELAELILIPYIGAARARKTVCGA